MTCVALNTGTYTLIVLSMYCGSRTDDKAKCEASLVGVAKSDPRQLWQLPLYHQCMRFLLLCILANDWYFLSFPI